MNQIEAARLADSAHALRPDWPKQSVMKLLHQVAAWAYRDVAVQLAYLACDPETETPARILTDGPWRKLTRLVDGGMPQPAPYQPMFEPLTPAERAKAAEAKAVALAELQRAREALHTKENEPA
jgi:hypothetical protein